MEKAVLFFGITVFVVGLLLWIGATSSLSSAIYDGLDDASIDMVSAKIKRKCKPFEKTMLAGLILIVLSSFIN